MYVLNLKTIGAATAATLPEELLAKLRVAAGDSLLVTEAPDRSFRLTPYEPMFAAQMEIAERVMREDQEILRALAK
jgi:antitoxin component of MazEF toxin-antitoxin module